MRDIVNEIIEEELELAEAGATKRANKDKKKQAGFSGPAGDSGHRPSSVVPTYSRTTHGDKMDASRRRASAGAAGKASSTDPLQQKAAWAAQEPRSDAEKKQVSTQLRTSPLLDPATRSDRQFQGLSGDSDFVARDKAAQAQISKHSPDERGAAGRSYSTYGLSGQSNNPRPGSSYNQSPVPDATKKAASKEGGGKVVFGRYYDSSGTYLGRTQGGKWVDAATDPNAQSQLEIVQKLEELKKSGKLSGMAINEKKQLIKNILKPN